MAETIKTNTEYESYFWVEWSATQDIPANKSTIAWSCGVYCGHKFYANAIRMSAVIINGVQVYGGGTYSNYYEGKHTIASGSMEVQHNTDGQKTFTVSPFTGWLYSNHNYSSNGGSYNLPTIPRKATITAASDFTDLDNPSISFSNPGGFPMDVWIELNPVGDHLCVKNSIPNTGTYTWTLTDAERDALRNRCAGTECTARLGLYTHIGDTTYADYKDKKFTIQESQATKPTVSVGLSLVNDSLPDGMRDLCIQGKTCVCVTLSATGKYGANIQNYWATVAGKTYQSEDFDSDVLQSCGDVKIVGYAKDSRKFTGSAERTIYVREYSRPLVIPLGSENSIQCFRSDGNGNRIGNSTSLWIKAKISYHDIGGRNGCALQWRWKPVAEVWNDAKHLWSDLLSTGSSTDEYNSSVEGVFDVTKSYTVQIRAIDTIGGYDIKTFEIPTQDVALHLGRGGKNVSIGTYCDYAEERTFYSDWKAIFDKEVYIGGTRVSNHVVDEGIKDTWKYRKWSDGSAELWGICTATHANGSVLGGRLEYPFALTGTVYGIGTLNSAGGNGVGALPWNLKLTYGTDLCEVWVHNSGSVGFASDSTADVSVYIVGRWK